MTDLQSARHIAATVRQPPTKGKPRDLRNAPMATLPNRRDPAMVPADELQPGNCRIWAKQALELADQARNYRAAGGDHSATQSTALAQVYATLASSLHLDSAVFLP